MNTITGPRGIARRTDPITSHEAGTRAARQNGPTSRARVLEILTEHGPLTHDQIIGRHQAKEVDEGWSELSVERLRSATNELVRANQVEAVPGEWGRSKKGNRASLWRVISVQQKETGGQSQ